ENIDATAGRSLGPRPFELLHGAGGKPRCRRAQTRPEKADQDVWEGDLFVNYVLGISTDAGPSIRFPPHEVQNEAVVCRRSTIQLCDDRCEAVPLRANITRRYDKHP